MDALTQLLTEVLEEEGAALGEDAMFAECSLWDSLKHVELVVGIERRFSVDLSPTEIAQLTCKRAARQILAARGVR